MPHAPAKPGGININGIDFLYWLYFLPDHHANKRWNKTGERRYGKY
jgi:hypothetical protein